MPLRLTRKPKAPARRALHRKRSGVRPRVPASGMMPHLAARLLNSPLLIHRPKLDSLLSVLGPRIGLRPDRLPVRMMDDDELEDFLAPADSADQQEGDPGDGLCIIPVHGSLIKRGSWMDSESGLSSYCGLQDDIAHALADDTCSAIVLDIDSPGGEANGMFDLADYIYSVRGTKPIIGIANDMAYSAGYALAAQCDQLLLTGVGGVGSIGCWMLHCDRSKFDAEMGLDFTYVFSGERKIDGNPHQPLSDAALAADQKECDRIRAMFVQAVARSRGVDPAALYDTEAACYMGAEACPMLADGVGTLEDACDLALKSVKGARSIPMRPAGAANQAAERMQIATMLSALRGGAFVDFAFPAPDTKILALRKSGPAALAGSGATRQVTGVLAPYDSLSCDLGGFREVYQRGCFSEFLATDDPRVLFNHDPNCLLGRKSAGTASFTDEPDGLHYTADLPDTQVARDLQVLMERGDIRESSAAFYILQYRWEQRGETRVRVIEKARLVEGSPHSFAAYESSTAGLPDSTAAADLVSVELLKARLELAAL